MIEAILESISQRQDEILAQLKELRNSGAVENKNKVYDFCELEQMLHVSRRTLFKWKSAGLMRLTQVGKKLYMTDSELKRFFETNKIN